MNLEVINIDTENRIKTMCCHRFTATAQLQWVLLRAKFRDNFVFVFIFYWITAYEIMVLRLIKLLLPCMHNVQQLPRNNNINE